MSTPPQSLRPAFLTTATKEDLRSAFTEAGLTVQGSTYKAGLISLWADNARSLPEP